MLTTQQKTLRKFWYATMPVSHLADGPKPFRLMNEDIVLFLDADGAPAGAARPLLPPNRQAVQRLGGRRQDRLRLSWLDLRSGLEQSSASRNTTHLPACLAIAWTRSIVRSRYGYVWVALDEPLLPLFDIPEDGEPGFRRIFQFYDQWQTAPLRLMENSFDNAHFSFVHHGTFGDNAQPMPSKYEIEETDYGFVATTVVEIINPPAAYRVTGTTDPTTTRTMRNHWYLPFCRRMDMTYPSGIRHIIINCATPIDDGRIQLVQLLYRNDTEDSARPRR